MQRFGDGLATGPDLLAAAEAATAQALEPLAGRPPDLACVFVTGDDAGLVAAAGERVAQRSAATALVGCSATGVLAGGRGVEGASAVAVWAALLPGVRVRTFHLEVMAGGPTAAVLGLPPPEGDPSDDQVALLLADPWTFPADGFAARANLALPGLPVVGGLASGGRGATRLFLDGRTVDRGAVGAVVAGAGVTTLVSQGCRAVGPAMTVTDAAGNVVRGLAGRPALDKVEEVLADLDPRDQALASAGLHLGLALDEYVDDVDLLVRAVTGVERSTSSLVVGDLVEVGRTVRLLVRDADAADADLRALLARYRGATGDAPVGGGLLFSCTGRGAALFGDADHDARVVRDELAVQGLAGFFAAGELGPVGGRNGLHSFSASLLAFPG